jgi:hypothetical protein
MCSSKPICAVLKTQMCSHQINKNITSKQSSHLLVFLVDAPDARNAVIEHLKSKCFLGEDHHADPHIFLTNHIRAGGNGTGGKIGPSDAIQKRLEWENLIFFAA